MDRWLASTLLLGVSLVLVNRLATAQTVAPRPEEGSLVLEGVIVAGNPSSSIALIRRAGSKRARPLRVGQEFSGYVLLEVTRSSVSLAGAAGRMRLYLAGQGVESAPTEKAPDPWIHRDFSGSETVARFEKEIPVILSETGLTARVEGGEVRGLTLTRLPDGTLLSESGLELGDVILSINGEPLRGLDRLWDLLARFKDASELRVIVERRGKVVRFAYALQN
jgi:type II secretion system protein C